jgi:hypothetical protein
MLTVEQADTVEVCRGGEIHFTLKMENISSKS